MLVDEIVDVTVGVVAIAWVANCATMRVESLVMTAVPHATVVDTVQGKLDWRLVVVVLGMVLARLEVVYK